MYSIYQVQTSDPTRSKYRFVKNTRDKFLAVKLANRNARMIGGKWIVVENDKTILEVGK
jgi:hypothetical protein